MKGSYLGLPGTDIDSHMMEEILDLTPTQSMTDEFEIFDELENVEETLQKKSTETELQGRVSLEEQDIEAAKDRETPKIHEASVEIEENL